MCVEHDLCVSDVRVLWADRAALRKIVGHKSRRNRHVDRIPGLCQGWLIIAIDEIAHNQVAHEGGQGIGRHELDDGGGYISRRNCWHYFLLLFTWVCSSVCALMTPLTLGMRFGRFPAARAPVHRDSFPAEFCRGQQNWPRRASSGPEEFPSLLRCERAGTPDLSERIRRDNLLRRRRLHPFLPPVGRL